MPSMAGVVECCPQVWILSPGPRLPDPDHVGPHVLQTPSPLAHLYFVYLSQMLLTPFGGYQYPAHRAVELKVYCIQLR